MMIELTQAELRRILCYNPLSGNFMWRIKPSKRIQLGSIAGTIKRRDKHGGPYRRIKIRRQIYAAHRLAFLYMKGYWPCEIDHKDIDGLNNRWLNIRECTRSQNLANRRIQRNNKLNVKGVRYDPRRKKYRTCIYWKNKQIFLGRFDTIEAASRAYQKAAKKYFKEFARI